MKAGAEHGREQLVRSPSSEDISIDDQSDLESTSTSDDVDDVTADSDLRPYIFCTDGKSAPTVLVKSLFVKTFIDNTTLQQHRYCLIQKRGELLLLSKSHELKVVTDRPSPSLALLWNIRAPQAARQSGVLHQEAHLTGSSGAHKLQGVDRHTGPGW